MESHECEKHGRGMRMGRGFGRAYGQGFEHGFEAGCRHAHRRHMAAGNSPESMKERLERKKEKLTRMLGEIEEQLSDIDA